jgi:hypothetical protein
LRSFQIVSYRRPKSGWKRISVTERGRGSPIVYTLFTRPGEAVITTMRSDSAMASSRSWVTKSTVRRRWAQISSRSFSIRLRVCTSSAPKGSSISTISGS